MTKGLPHVPRESYSELTARERAAQLLDPDSSRELLGPFDRLSSPWLPLQGIVAQNDDGVVIARGTLDGVAAIVIATEGAFLGGSIGEVSGEKIATALDLARAELEEGHPLRILLLLDTGGVRLQEANLGLAAIASIHAAVVAVRRLAPVVGVVAGKVGCFGGMSITAALCSHLIVTPGGRLCLNGPEVIEQEAGRAEFDSCDRELVWRVTGGKQRQAAGLADFLVEDSVEEVAAAIREAFHQRPSNGARSEDVERGQRRLAEIKPESFGPPKTACAAISEKSKSRGRTWFEGLTGDRSTVSRGSVLASDVRWGGDRVRCLAVVPDGGARFPRARGGQVGLEEGWLLAKAVREVMAETGEPRPIVAIVDVPSQAYGRVEECAGIFLALAAAVDAYASARIAGHPVISLLVGNAMSGAFLAHGYQANRLLALDDREVLVHAMGKDSAARVTKRDGAEVERLARDIVPMAYDVQAFEKLGFLHRLIKGVNADAPAPGDLDRVRAELTDAIAAVRSGTTDPAAKLLPEDREHARKAGIETRRRMESQW